MIDLLLIFFLLNKRYNIKEKWFPSLGAYERFRTKAIYIVIALSIIKLFIPIPRELLFYGPLHYAGFFGYVMIGVAYLFYAITFFTYPLLMGVFALFGFIGYLINPTVKDDDFQNYRKQECSKYHSNGYFAYDLCASYYGTTLSVEGDYKNYMPKIRAMIKDIQEKIATGYKKTCDPTKDRDFLFRTAQKGMYSSPDGKVTCNEYLNLNVDLLKVADTAAFDSSMYLDPHPIYRVINGDMSDKTGKPYEERYYDPSLFATYQGCMKRCQLIDKLGKYYDSAPDVQTIRTVTGRLAHPLECEWRCQNYEKIMDFIMDMYKICMNANIDIKDNHNFVTTITCREDYAYYARVRGLSHGKKYQRLYEKHNKIAESLTKQQEAYEKTDEFKRLQKLDYGYKNKIESRKQEERARKKRRGLKAR